MLCSDQEGKGATHPGIHVGTQLELDKRRRRLVLMLSKLQEEVLQECKGHQKTNWKIALF